MKFSIHKTARRLLIERRTRQFVARGKDAAAREARAGVALAFRRIHNSVICTHDELELLFIAGFVLDHPGLGPIVECGAFKGGSTAKLSILAEAVDVPLHVYDSFQGLPEPERCEGTDVNTAGAVTEWKCGLYAGSESEVRASVEARGVPGRCHYHQGYFDETRPGGGLHPGYAFIDVDLASSARACLQHLWPGLTKGGRLYFHDVAFEGFSRGIADHSWWRNTLGEPPPILWGAGYGCGDMAPNVGYFEKS